MKKLFFLSLATTIVIFTFIWFFIPFNESTQQAPIKVGILHSLTGTMSTSEKPVVNATLLAIDEINRTGGLLSRKIEPILIDGKSSDESFAKGADLLINKHKVSVIFGCWTSASRKAVKPIIEKNNHVLFYPVQYEGLESSSHIIYVGATANQQIIPATTWSLHYLGKKLFLVGSDYIFPRTANKIIKEVAYTYSAKIVGEEYQPLGSTDFTDIVKKIKQSSPDVILNTINGSSNKSFFEQLRKEGISPQTIPVMSFSIAENQVKEFQLLPESIGDFACWSYFNTIDTKENKEFIKKYKAKFGDKNITDDPMEAAYIAVNIWKQAALKGNSLLPDDILRNVKGQLYQAPEGLVIIDRFNNHTWKKARIGQLDSNGAFNIIWQTEKLIKPKPFPQISH